MVAHVTTIRNLAHQSPSSFKHARTRAYNLGKNNVTYWAASKIAHLPRGRSVCHPIRSSSVLVMGALVLAMQLKVAAVMCEHNIVYYMEITQQA